MEDYTISEVMEFIEENDVKFIRLAFCDIFGNQKNISIMPEKLRDAIVDGIGFNSSQIVGFAGTKFQNLYLKPDLSTLSVLPWRPQQGRVIRFYCDIVTPDGEPFLYDARKFLRDTLKECAKFGISIRTGLRSEFYLFKTDDEGKTTEIPWDEGGYLDIAPLDRGENIRREICLCLEEMGISPESSHHESGPGQNEIDFHSADALGTADNFITYKNVVSAISARNGVYASFDPKPIRGKSGNGLHLKFSCWKNGVNLAESEPQLLESFMAGIFNRIKDITVFLNTEVESYERFGENEAPKYITWSEQNQSRFMRAPVINGKKSCFILRSPDSGINPYIAIAIVIQAGLAGIRGDETLPEAVEKGSKDMTKEERTRYEALPESLEDAIAIARKSDFLKQPSCEKIATHFIDVVEKERV